MPKTSTELSGTVKQLRSGLTEVDAVVGGFEPGSLTVIAGRPSMGASSLGLTIARNVASRVGGRTSVSFTSLALTERAFNRRMRSLEAGAPPNGTSGTKDASDQEAKAGRDDEQTIGTKIHFQSCPELSVHSYAERASSLQQEHGFGLLIVDSLHLVNDSLLSAAQDPARTLKALAMELGVPLIVVTSVSRSVEERGGNMKPMTKDLQGPDEIEEAADTLMLLYRAENYGIMVDSHGNSTERVAELAISKRDGVKETVELAFVPKYARFEDAGKNHS
jgi:replicative DNA helicase